MNAKKITIDEFQKEVCDEKKQAFVDFWADWCSPCRMMSPVVDEMAGEYNDMLVLKVNVEEEKELAARYGIMSIPTFMFFSDGKPVESLVGVQTAEEVKNFIRRNKKN